MLIRPIRPIRPRMVPLQLFQKSNTFHPHMLKYIVNSRRRKATHAFCQKNTGNNVHFTPTTAVSNIWLHIAFAILNSSKYIHHFQHGIEERRKKRRKFHRRKH